MKITTKIVFDIESWTVLEHEWFEYSGPVDMFKGSNSKAEQAAADAQRQAQTGLMQQALGAQNMQLGAVNATLDPMIANGGLAPGVENAMTAQVMNNIPAQFRGIQGNINNQLVARGITGGQSGAGGGDVARQFGQLGAMQASMQQQGLTDIQMQKQQALMGDLGLKMGIGSQYGQQMSGFNQGASSALGQGVTAANNADQASTGLWGAALGALGGLGGSIASGGMSNLGKGKGFFG
jgi:hypothetical protein